MEIPLFFTFDRRDIGVSCLRDIPASSRDKDWKKKFFYIDAGVIPGGMHWREMGAKDKFKDDGPPADAYIENALFKRLSQRPSECQLIPEGALVKAGMSLPWRNSWLYPAFQRVDGGEWSLFDFFNPPRNAALRSADRVVGEQEPNVLKIHIEQFLPPAVPAGSTAQVSNPPPSGGVSVEETRKPSRIRISGKNIATAGMTASPVTASVSTTPEDVAVTSAPALVSLRPAPKRRRIMPPLSTFQATKAAQALHVGSLAEAQVESGSSMPLTSGEIVPSAAGGQSVTLADLISQASAFTTGSSMPPPLFTTSIVMTPSSVTTPLFSSSTPVSIFDSPISDFLVSGKDMPVTSAGG
ncbi:hypothetical protein HanIR_Chr14g0687481 [Helianthus annuus]|nr:hypothetical protein HanIR_Chr14g0687481 [Helianthus annuus]